MNKQTQPVKGFSKWSKQAKLEWLISNYSADPGQALKTIEAYWHVNPDVQKIHDEFIENAVTNFYLPFGVAPNFQVNGTLYALPMAIEESSVVAAASKAANFWIDRGGFKAEILQTTKIGHVHFIWNGKDKEAFQRFFDRINHEFISGTNHITANMRARGGGISSVQLVDKTQLEPGYYQLELRFETCDSMGANFINSCLEECAGILQNQLHEAVEISEPDRSIQVVMCILSNFTPECLVRAEVTCPLDAIEEGSGIGNLEFAEKFCRAVRIAEIEPYRAVTHNKGIMNGIDAVVLATGNDFRAVEACAHAYAARSGHYTSLTHASMEHGMFRFWIEIPLALGTVGGITRLHPVVKFAHEMLGNPNAQELMMITAAAGLAQNFSAIRSLITTGIQKGHMKMHLLNILNQLEATEQEKEAIVAHFKDKVVSHSAAVAVFCEMRGISSEAFAKLKH
jgi:hydroxymethylglutaryl-CoA reductase